MNGLAGLIVPMSESKRDPNLDIFNAPEVASYYSSLNYLTPCERLLFDQYLSWGMTILESGSGWRRKTSYLSSIAGRYVGADYAAAMIAACQRKFPNLEFEVVGATDLSIFTASSPGVPAWSAARANPSSTLRWD